VIGPTPKGPKGEKRPADVIGAAVMMTKIATGEIDESTKPDSAAHPRAQGRTGPRRQSQGGAPQLGYRGRPFCVGETLVAIRIPK
jgi:hypothetical protein